MNRRTEGVIALFLLAALPAGVDSHAEGRSISGAPPSLTATRPALLPADRSEAGRPLKRAALRAASAPVVDPSATGRQILEGLKWNTHLHPPRPAPGGGHAGRGGGHAGRQPCRRRRGGGAPFSAHAPGPVQAERAGAGDEAAAPGAGRRWWRAPPFPAAVAGGARLGAAAGGASGCPQAGLSGQRAIWTLSRRGGSGTPADTGGGAGDGAKASRRRGSGGASVSAGAISSTPGAVGCCIGSVSSGAAGW